MSVHPVENDSASKKKWRLLPWTAEMNLEDVMLSEMSITKGQVPTDKYQRTSTSSTRTGIPMVRDTRVVKFTEKIDRHLPGRRGGDGESVLSGDRTVVWEGGKVPETDGGDGCTAMGMYLMLLNGVLNSGKRGQL